MPDKFFEIKVQGDGSYYPSQQQIGVGKPLHINRSTKEEIMKLVKNTAVAVALGTVFVGSAFAAQAQANPFGYSEMQAGYQIVDGEGKCGEGKCGENMKKSAKEGKCGAQKKAMKEGKCGEGKCGEGKCGEAMKKGAKEGKCGEGKCGAQMKAQKEGKCGEEMKAKEGKCGEGMKKAKEGKCGGNK